MTALVLLSFALTAPSPQPCPPNNLNACGSLYDRVDACVNTALAAYTVGPKPDKTPLRCGDLPHEPTSWACGSGASCAAYRDSCKSAEIHVLRPSCEKYEIAREDVPGYRPPRTAKERVRACVDARWQEEHGPQARRHVEGGCWWEETYWRGGADHLALRKIEKECRKAAKNKAQLEQCCAYWGGGRRCQ